MIPRVHGPRGTRSKCTQTDFASADSPYISTCDVPIEFDGQIVYIRAASVMYSLMLELGCVLVQVKTFTWQRSGIQQRPRRASACRLEMGVQMKSRAGFLALVASDDVLQHVTAQLTHWAASAMPQVWVLTESLQLVRQH